MSADIYKLPLLRKIEAEKRESKEKLLQHLKDFLNLKKLTPVIDLNSYTGERKCDHFGNTYKRYKNFFDNFHKLYGKFDSFGVIKWKAAAVESGKKNSTYNNELTIMKQFSDYLYEVGFYERRLINTKVLKFRKLSDQTNYPVVDKLDLAYLLTCNSDDKILNYIHFALISGLRAQELVDLPKFKFNKKTRSIKVVGKGRNIRRLNLTPELLALRRKMVADPFNTTNYLNKRLKAFLVKHELTIYSFHSFRATYATSLYQTGEKIEAISRMLGHQSIDTTKRYIKTLRDNEPVELVNPYKDIT